MSRELDQLIELDGLDPADEVRLRRLHDLLVEAGPPAGGAAGLRSLPASTPSPRRGWRRAATLPGFAAVAAVAAVCFGSGYLLADQAHQATLHATEVVSLQGAHARDSFASLRVGSADEDGNWPITLTVTGLPELRAADARYVLMLWRDGRPTSLCGNFKVGRSGPTTVSFTVPYAITRATRWVVTEMTPGKQFPGPVVMTSS